MELGPLICCIKIFTTLRKSGQMFVLFIFLLLERSFPHIIVYSSITDVVTWTFYTQFTILWNMEIGP